MVLSLEIMPLEEREPEPQAPKTMVVRYGLMRDIGEFPSDLKTKVGCGSKLVVRTNRGTEIAEMLTTVCGNGGCGKSITRDKLLDYISNSGGDKFPFTESGRVLRLATAQDLAQQRRLDEQKPRHLTMAREMVHQHKIPMKMVDIEYLLGGERILFYFTSEHRVDFRSLVRELVQRVHTRIELCQVGSRDEARLVADYDKCGQHCCCKQFLKVLAPISMRSAKVQRATLDPLKINGRCGRLMCCLRYEDQTYEELRKKLPPKNSRVGTAKGEAWVLDSQILTQLVLLLYDDGNQLAVPMENIETFNLPKPKLPGGRTMQFPGDIDRNVAPPAAGPSGAPPTAQGRRGQTGPRREANRGDRGVSPVVGPGGTGQPHGRQPANRKVPPDSTRSGANLPADRRDAPRAEPIVSADDPQQAADPAADLQNIPGSPPALATGFNEASGHQTPADGDRNLIAGTPPPELPPPTDSASPPAPQL